MLNESLNRLSIDMSQEVIVHLRTEQSALKKYGLYINMGW